MNTTIDSFCTWAGGGQKAADLLGVHESTVSRLRNGLARPSAAIAKRIEVASAGRFRKETVLWPEDEAA